VVAEQVTDWLSRLRELKVRFACGPFLQKKNLTAFVAEEK